MKLFLEVSGGAALAERPGGCLCRVSRRGARVRAAVVSCPGGDGTAWGQAGAVCGLAWSMLAAGAPLQGAAQALLANRTGRWGFTLLELDGRGRLRAVEWRMPPVALVRPGSWRAPWGGQALLAGCSVWLREDQVQPGELCCALSQGLVSPGLAEDWGRQEAVQFLARAYTGSQSARQMKNLLFSACRGFASPERLDGAAFFCRAKPPEALLLALGGPGRRPEEWARQIREFRGSRCLIGGQAAEALDRFGPVSARYRWAAEDLLQQALPCLQAPGAFVPEKDARQLVRLLGQCTSLRLLLGRAGKEQAQAAEQLVDWMRRQERQAELRRY